MMTSTSRTISASAHKTAGTYSRGSDVVPLYHRVYVILLQKLADGSFPAGQALPSEDELAASFNVSRVTIRKAMERLDHEKRISRQRGRGTFPLVQEAGKHDQDSHYIRSQISLAQKTSIALLDYTMTNAPQLWRDFSKSNGLESETNQKLLRITRVRFDTRSPISKTICHVPEDIAALLPQDKISSLPISAILTEAGIKLSRFREHISAVLADSETAQHLEVDVGSALLMITRWIEDETGRTVELLQALYRPDRYEYRIEYENDGQQGSESWRAMITHSHT